MGDIAVWWVAATRQVHTSLPRLLAHLSTFTVLFATHIFLLTGHVDVAHAASSISWQSETISTTIARGESDVFDVTATSDKKLRNLSLFVTPELAPFVTISPSTIPVMYAGVPVPIQVSVAIPTETPLDVYDGTVHIRRGTRTHSAVLPIVLSVGDAVGPEGDVITSADGRATLTVPPGAVSGDTIVFTVESIPLDELLPPPWGELVGPAYNFGPDDAIFDKPLTLTLQYAPVDIPPGFDELALRIARDTPIGDLFGLDGFVVNTTGQTVSADVWHFTRFVLVVAADITPPPPPTNVTVDVSVADPQRADIDWTNSLDSDFFYAKIYRSSTFGILGDVLVTEVAPVCPLPGPFPHDCTLGPPYTNLMTVGLNCYTVRSVDSAGNEDQNTNQACTFFTSSNNPPIAQDDFNTVSEDGLGSGAGGIGFIFALGDVIDGDGDPDTTPDGDPDGDTLFVTQVSNGTTFGNNSGGDDTEGNGVNPIGSVVVDGEYGALQMIASAAGTDPNYSYQLDNANSVVQALNEGQTLTDTFVYRISDGNGGTDTATLTITIFGTNDAP